MQQFQRTEKKMWIDLFRYWFVLSLGTWSRNVLESHEQFNKAYAKVLQSVQSACYLSISMKLDSFLRDHGLFAFRVDTNFPSRQFPALFSYLLRPVQLWRIKAIPAIWHHYLWQFLVATCVFSAIYHCFWQPFPAIVQKVQCCNAILSSKHLSNRKIASL